MTGLISPKGAYILLIVPRIALVVQVLLVSSGEARSKSNKSLCLSQPTPRSPSTFSFAVLGFFDVLNRELEKV